jgi:hypothetical protein
MANHFVYEDPKPELCQGDVLRKSLGLLALIKTYFQYYADHDDYKYLMVITQTCDLVRRDGGPCSSPYVTLAAMKPLRTALLMEAAKHQEDWQRETRFIGNKTKDKLVMFLESLFDNNKASFFYLHADKTVKILEPCCAFLQLAISLHSEHYDFLSAHLGLIFSDFPGRLNRWRGSILRHYCT